MINAITLIKNLFKIAKVLSTDDSGDLRFSQVSALGKKQQVLMFTPYGLMHHPPSTSVGLLWNQQAQGSNGICIADDPPNRILKDLAEGEVALGNYLTGSYIYFDKDGNANLVVKGNLVQTTDGNALTYEGGVRSEITIGNRTMDAATFEINGDGDNLVTWADLSSLLASYWAIYNGHTHGGSGVSASVSFNITAAKATTLKTDG